MQHVYYELLKHFFAKDNDLEFLVFVRKPNIGNSEM